MRELLSEGEKVMYDYLIVGSGLFGAVFAHQMTQRKKKCLVIERRNHIGGNCYTEEVEGIQVHKYGAHIFRTSNEKIWDYMRQFCKFNHFINSPIANYKGEIYNMPFNMNTFNKMWGVITPEEAEAKICEQRKILTHPPRNLEEHVIQLVGNDIYQKLVKGYTEKQWGRPCTELPASIMKRLPIRFTYDNNYFNDPYQGIPVGGYTAIIQSMFDGSEVQLGCDFSKNRSSYLNMAKKILYTGPIDEFFEYVYGPLEYRSLRFEHQVLDQENYQGVAVVNYTDRETPYTRIIEHKHFEFGKQKKTVISKEFPLEWHPGIEPYYPINDEKNQKKLSQYKELALQEKQILFGGRLGEYRYYDMQDTIASALKLSECESLTW